MKRIILVILVFCNVTLYAQVSKTVNLATAGTLSTVLTPGEQSSITNLTITGIIDARDFSTLEQMSLLKILDMRDASIAAFPGPRVPGDLYPGYLQNEIPHHAFMNNKIITEITIPSSADSLDYFAFYNFSGKINVDEKSLFFSSLDGVLFNKVKTKVYRCPVSRKGPYNLPETVKYIEHAAFANCKDLTYINLSPSLTYIGRYAFAWCDGLFSFNIPEFVTFIDEDAFDYDSSGGFKYDITVDPANKNFSSQNGVLFDKNKTRLMRFPKSFMGSYIIPSTVTSVDPSAFASCEWLTSISIPSSVSTIGASAFEGCKRLTGTLGLTSSLTKIEDFAFHGCDFTSVIIPNTIKSIGDWAFIGNEHLTTITIPSSVTFLGESAFGPGITAIYANSPVPIPIESTSEDVFWATDKSTCKLYVPYGTKTLYAKANQWRDFSNIIEDAKGFSVGATNITIASGDGSKASVNIKSNINWMASSSQSWLQVDPLNGSGTMSLSLTATANTSLTVRTAIVTLASEGELSQEITVTQDAAPKIVDNTAGALSSILTSDELKTITNLVITGTIDARDFKVMRDDMPLLASVDLTDATIVKYTGSGGTSVFDLIYEANTIPPYSLLDQKNNIGKETVKQIKLPISATAISYMAFAGPNGLLNITIPKQVSKIDDSSFNNSNPYFSVDSENSNYSSLNGVLFSKDKSSLLKYPNAKDGAFEIPNTVNTIANAAFKRCSRLESITIPTSVTSIGDYAFYECSGLSGTLSIPKSVKSIGFAAFLTCRGLKGTLIIPSSATSIGGYAFANCNGFTSLVIPRSITSIGNSAFAACQGLTSIYANSTVPVDLNSVTSVFDYVDKDKCILYVPIGSKTAYQAATQWKDFKNIVETTATEVKSINATNVNVYPNPFVEGFWIRGIDGPTTLRIYDINGKLILQKELLIDEFENASFLPDGIYVVKLSSSSCNFDLKIIKKN